MNNKSVEAVLERLAGAVGAETDSELARRMSVNRQTLSSWRQRKSVPYANCIQVSEDWGLSLDWLLTGEGPVRRVAGANAGSLSPKEQAILELFNDLDAEAQREIQTAAEEKKRVRDMERQLKELAEKFEQNKFAG